jgi:hypothetical protein
MHTGLKLGMAARRRGGGAAFGVTMTGLTDGEARIGDHASIGYTIDPDNGTETVKWSYSSDKDAAGIGTGANPPDITAGDEGSLWLHVTDGGETVSRSAPIRYAPGAFGALTNQSFSENTGNQTYVFDAATGANLTWTYSLVSPPTGVTIVSATRTITFDTDTLALQTGTVISVAAVDQYGRAASGSPRTFDLAIADTPVLTLVADDLDQDPPVYIFDTTQSGTVTWDFHSSATPPAVGAGDIATGTIAVTAGEVEAELDLSAYTGETGYIHWRQADSNILTSQEITVASAGSFAPADLFGASEAGFFYDLKADYAYTEDTGTTPASVNDTIAYVDDLSGNSNPLTQSSTAREPTLEQDGSGNQYTIGDGVDATLASSSVDFTGASEFWFFAAAQDGGSGFALSLDGVDFMYLRFDPTQVFVRPGTGASSSATVSVSTWTSAPVVWRVRMRQSDRSIEVWRNGVSQGSSTVAGTDWFGNMKINLHCGQPGTGHSTSKVYAAGAIIKALSSQEQSDIDSWLADRSGVTL